MKYEIHDSCVACRTCATVCPKSAPYFDGIKFSIDPEKCVGCGLCAKNCYEQAIWPAGEPEPEHAPVKEKESACDLVVIGGGPAGLTAAARAAESGKKVIVLESAQHLGGAGVYATGFTAINTKWERDAGAPDLLDDYVRAAMNATDWALDPQLVANCYRESGRFFDWFCQWGNAEERFAVGFSPFSGRIGLNVKDMSKPGGPFLVKKLIEKCESLGVDFRLGHRASRLMVKDGAVQGVAADTDAGEVTIHCENCLLATGAMTVSPDLERFVPAYANAKHCRNPHRLPGSSGDGVRMLENAQIQVDVNGVASHYTGGMPVFFDKHVLEQAFRPDALKVNLNGQRWTNESLERMSTVSRLIQQPHGVSYTIVDSVSLQRTPLGIMPVPKVSGGFGIAASIPKPGEKPALLNLMGFPLPPEDAAPEGAPPKEDGLANMRDGMGDYAPGEKPTHARLAELSKLPGGHVFTADTLEELAEKIGLPVDTFMETVKRYNQVCAEKHDTDFFKTPEYLFPLEKGPFYAFQVTLCTDGCFGGVFIDPKCRVKNGDAIVKGLYAGGDLTSGNFTVKGGNRVEIINDLSWAIISGWMAAEDICSR